ncbi:alkaline-shock protein [Listeria monocytogenes]|nr:alkaline-shock protein [Listeria monocytogenes]GAT40742.1 alkaline-shock protein [Listeria monocytogenes]
MRNFGNFCSKANNDIHVNMNTFFFLSNYNTFSIIFSS